MTRHLLDRTRTLDDPDDIRAAARELAEGATVGHGFGNFYVISSRPDAATVRGINLLKGRPPGRSAASRRRRRGSRCSSTGTLFHRA
jgi:hypothetical protein